MADTGTSNTGAPAPLTGALAAFIAGFDPGQVPPPVMATALAAVRDGTGALVAATNPAYSTSRLIADLIADLGGSGQSTVVGTATRTNAVDAALANGTLAYACDFEPSNSKGLVHSIAVMLPTALAVGERVNATGREFMGAVVLGCEVAYRVSCALGPAEQYALGFHPSALSGGFGAAAAASYLLKLDADAAARALGLLGCQASGMMAWETDPTENARPFQIGVAARNGVTSALLAGRGFGGPAEVFDTGHTVFHAFSRKPSPALLTEHLGETWDGIAKLKIKPYPCVSFLHPALDALFGLVRDEGIQASDVRELILHFARSGVHCIDSNPLKSHCAQYVLPVALVNGALKVDDLFIDRRLDNPLIAKLGKTVRVEADGGELEALFPQRYASVIELRTHAGKSLTRRNDIARGNPETPLSEDELVTKFKTLCAPVADDRRTAALLASIARLPNAPNLTEYAALLGERPRA